MSAYLSLWLEERSVSRLGESGIQAAEGALDAMLDVVQAAGAARENGRLVAVGCVCGGRVDLRSPVVLEDISTLAFKALSTTFPVSDDDWEYADVVNAASELS